MKTITVILLVATSHFLNAQRYHISLNKALDWGTMAIAGSLHGAREAFHADPTVFERKWHSGPYSFFGSHQWERNYETNRYRSPDGTINEHKSEVFGNFGRDYWHTSDKLILVGTGYFCISRAGSKQSWKHKALDLIIGSTVLSVSSWLTYKYFRR